MATSRSPARRWRCLSGIAVGCASEGAAAVGFESVGTGVGGVEAATAGAAVAVATG